MGQGAIDYIGVKGGLDINGIIEDYYVYAGENVSAGDFVEFINGISNSKTETSSITQLTFISGSTTAGDETRALLLSSGKVLVIYYSQYLYGIVCTVNGTTITYGTAKQISTQSNGSNYYASIKLIEVSNNKIFITYDYNASNYCYLYGIVCNISGTTITVGTAKQLSTTRQTARSVSLELLGNGKVFLIHSYGTAIQLYGMICTISGTSISTGTDTALATTSYTGGANSSVLLPSGNIFIAHVYGSDGYLYGMVCTISGTTITKGTDTQIETTVNAGSYISTSLLENGNVFVAHSYSNDYHLYGIVCTISEMTITKGTDTALYKYKYSGQEGISIASIPNNKVVVLHSSGYTTANNSYYQYYVICSIAETVITKGTNTVLDSSKAYNGQGGSILTLSNGTIFVAHSHYDSSYGFNTYAQIYGVNDTTNLLTNRVVLTEYETQVRPATSLPCVGVAKSSGEGGNSTAHKDVVSVYVNEV